MFCGLNEHTIFGLVIVHVLFDLALRLNLGHLTLRLRSLGLHLPASLIFRRLRLEPYFPVRNAEGIEHRTQHAVVIQLHSLLRQHFKSVWSLNHRFDDGQVAIQRITSR